MAIKIPRANIEIPSVGNQRSLLDTTRQDRINFEGLTADITSVAKSINAHNTAIERERIRNKATKESAKMLLDINDFVQTLEKGDKNGNPFNQEQIEEKIINFEKNYLSRNYGVDSKVITGKYFNDTQASKDYFSSYYWNNLNTFRTNSHAIVKKRILADTELTFNTIKTEQANKVIIPRIGMWDENGPWAIDRKEIIESWKALEAAGNVTTDIETELKIVDDRYWRKAVIGEGDYRTDAMGNRVVDNLAIVAKLKSKNNDGSYKEKKFFGKTLDETTRQELITYYQNQAQNQDLTESRHIKRTNDDIVANAAPAIIDNKMDITEISNLEIVGPDAEIIKADLKELRKRVVLNQIPKEADIKTYKHINEGLIDGSITSLYQKFLVEGEVATAKNPDGWSIIERMKLDQKAKYGAVSDTDGQKWKNFLDQKYSNPQYLKNIRNFEEWWKKYEKTIIGKHQSDMDNITPAGLKRMEAVKAEALRIYLDGIEKGISSENLRNPDSKDYLWTQMGGVKKFIPTYAMETNEIKEFFSTKMGTNEADAPYLEGGKFAPPRKKVTQSYNDWINSKEYLEWKNSDKYQKWIIWFNEKNNSKL